MNAKYGYYTSLVKRLGDRAGTIRIVIVERLALQMGVWA